MFDTYNVNTSKEFERRKVSETSYTAYASQYTEFQKKHEDFLIMANSKKLPNLSLSHSELNKNLTLRFIHIREYYVLSNGLTKAIIKDETKARYIKSDTYLYSFR